MRKVNFTSYKMCVPGPVLFKSYAQKIRKILKIKINLMGRVSVCLSLGLQRNYSALSWRFIKSAIAARTDLPSNSIS